ncbi:MAG: response regulator [Planctomycetes bacterium]|nr:response regulator [Planctomycetota bacterium]
MRERIAELEHELLRANLAGESSGRAKSSFLANMNHEIRTPIHTSLGFLKLLGKDELTASQRTKIDHITFALSSLLELFNDILTLSKAETGHLKLHPTRFHLESLIHDTLNHASALAVSKNLDVRHEVDERLPKVLMGDRCRLRQVLVNLFGNALKFTAQGTVTLRAIVEDETEQSFTIRFEVEDTGLGIKPNRLAEALEPFTQGDGSATRQYGGTGTGLALCRQLVELMRGKLNIESELGQGTKCWFSVKLDKVVDEKRGRRNLHGADERVTSTSPETQDAAATPETKILIVDDDRLCRVLLDEMLSEYGVRHQAQCGRDAVRIVAQALEDGSPYDLVCLDIMMPGMDGHSVLEEIRRLDAQDGREGKDATKVVMTTALRDSQHCVQAFREGCEAYLTKPIEDEALAKALDGLGITKAQTAAC